MTHRKAIHNVSDLSIKDKDAMEMVSIILKGEIIELTQNWWCIVGDEKVEQRYKILQELKRDMTPEQSSAIYKRIDAVV